MNYILPFLFAVLASNVFAQLDEGPDTAYIQFLPNSMLEANTSLTLPQNLLVFEAKKKLLYWTGSFLEGVKFNDAVDEFNALTPFDRRALTPTNYSDYTHQISNYGLLLDVHPAPKW